MFKYLRQFVRYCSPGAVQSRNEQRKIKRILKNVDRKSKVLEVGCGYGDKIHLLKSLGFKDILGIEKNPIIVDQDRKNSLRVVSVDEFWKHYNGEEYDLLVMSHIIEHFQAREMIDFIDRYLECLKQGGYVLIITPINWGLFYGDIDHVKPYYPTGVEEVFGATDMQVQIYSNNHLELENIYFRRTPLRLAMFRSLFLRTRARIPITIINMILSLLSMLSFELIGKTNGWIGLYRNIGSSQESMGY